ncbi:PhoH family protein [Catenovulum adriaticum]|uniref:PhoH family protein n=1 Tax=Catenovulum adriaticum TaxID=2984846 RepID=A0ABY7AMI9_9ALTE|nr:PhoH family protein [Catenovulum sp. TS8]WAJ70773.1 PhoH family protein [Catenovulum sp. TS8]
MSEAHTKIYILDTNILLHEPFAFLNFQEHDVYIPMTVLEELDAIKDRKKDVSRDARIAIRALEEALQDAPPEDIVQGVSIAKYSADHSSTGNLAIFPDHLLNQELVTLPGPENDNHIINAALHLQKEKSPRQVVLVTKDINMRLKAKGAGLERVEDYKTDQLISDIKYLSTGYVEVEGEFWESVTNCDSQTSGRETVHTVAREVLPQTVFINQYVFDQNHHFAGKVVEHDSANVRLKDLGYERMMGRTAWGISPKNFHQAMALDSLLDTNIDLTLLTGPAGSGKTLLALAAALEMVVEKGIYEKIIVTRNTPEIAESIGFLPGTEEEKMAPWLGAINDALDFLHRHDECRDSSMRYIMEKANIQFKSVNFMRGRSIQKSVVILDECQNMTSQQLKTIITRAGEGTKLICCGNLAQIDSNYLSPLTSGLTYIVERFKDFEGSATVHIAGVMRSRLASFAENNL